MFIRNAWYVAATTAECNTERPLSRTLLGDKVVLFRTGDGRPAALADRCAHRLAPLSLGDIEADGLRCRYHGMKFDATGRCVEIPGQADIPPVMRVRDYPVVERHGFIWIWPGDAARADAELIVDCHWNNAPGWPTASGYIHYKANYQLVADNLLDFSHLTFVHRTTLANSAFPNARPDVVPFERGIRLYRQILDCEPSPLHAMAGGFTGKVDFWNRQVWWLPSVFENWAGSAEAGGEGPPHERPGALHFRHFSLLTPETEKSTHYFWIHPCEFPHGDAGLIDPVGDGIRTAFAEDRWVIEAQQEVMDASPGVQPKGAGSDVALNRVRHMIAQRVRQEAQAAAVAATEGA
ncbi:aromatic ring-hydroxylating dioxygenase subunit alpha [Ramlibacter sp. AW1]|uniref:Aromatic ring-hydroxylating dioxygenase subunit alpha n=1 Tax=Ramlibacter aurantiacus TaxID=2801330 RepID=A0A936ZGW5_9BURK|nr:aromatic ring-hydroxylating dioxygenase subunit alpha [Ramlibacter aurantiacus]MBL0420702.1 aromatic ring-hydroxylating dioxygenase subunit alpha [Ramlibacter aurantiacus]